MVYLILGRYLQQLEKIKDKMVRRHALQNLMVYFIPSLWQISDSVHTKVYCTRNMWPSKIGGVLIQGGTNIQGFIVLIPKSS